MWEEAVLAYFPNIYMDRLRKAMRNLKIADPRPGFDELS
jgi:hypothetical protein